MEELVFKIFIRFNWYRKQLIKKGKTHSFWFSNIEYEDLKNHGVNSLYDLPIVKGSACTSSLTLKERYPKAKDAVLLHVGSIDDYNLSKVQLKTKINKDNFKMDLVVQHASKAEFITILFWDWLKPYKVKRLMYHVQLGESWEKAFKSAKQYKL